MVEKLDALDSGTSVVGNQNICECVAIGCKGSKDRENYQVLCSVNKGYGCEYKLFRSIPSEMRGVL